MAEWRSSALITQSDKAKGAKSMRTMVAAAAAAVAPDQLVVREDRKKQWNGRTSLLTHPVSSQLPLLLPSVCKHGLAVAAGCQKTGRTRVKKKRDRKGTGGASSSVSFDQHYERREGTKKILSLISSHDHQSLTRLLHSVQN